MDQKRIKRLRKAVGKLRFNIDQGLEHLKKSKEDIIRIKDGGIRITENDRQIIQMLAVMTIGMITINEYEAQLSYYERRDDDDDIQQDTVPS